MGRRVVKDIGAVTTHFLYDRAGRLIAEADGATGAGTAEYVWLNGIPLAFVRGGQTFFVHTDHLGTPQVLTDAVGAIAWSAVYRPFGETAHVGGSVTFNLRFPGQYFDAETGLRYNWFRDYDPALGRYVQSDLIGLRGGWNTFTYVVGNPVKLVDPEGLIFAKINVPDIEAPNLNNGTWTCPAAYDNSCADRCKKHFEAMEEYRLNKLLNGLEDCKYKPSTKGIVNCGWGIVTFDYGLQYYNRRQYERCLKNCRDA